VADDDGGRIGNGRLEGKVTIITGAARGLGANMAEIFAREGSKVLVTDIRDELGEAVAAQITASGGIAAYQHLDVTSEDDWRAGVARCEAELGPPNVLVSNAFLFSHPPVLDVSVDEWKRGIDVNLNGTFYGVRAVVPGMRERGQGTIVGISSSNGNEIALPGQAAYQAAKAGMSSILRHLAVTYAKDGIRANTIHPGPIRTPVLEEQDFLGAAEFVATGFPIARLGQPEEVSWAAVFLASDESSYITATSLVVDGGSVATLNVPTAP
jgi:NAD(P)-dependent dehydrogenase (short-subunit alcohol dehydrogenase family)